MVAAGGRRR